ncbi:MAG: hypothetical protein RR578_04585 [Bacilli bacterium]|uniref:hypothetical protein n=1 Tax=Algoriella sp. TaxID=1872434 RepID=UPI002FC77BCB
MKKIYILTFISSILFSCTSNPEDKWRGKWNFDSYKVEDISQLYSYYNISKSGEIDQYLMPLIGVDYLMVEDGNANNLSGLNYSSGKFTADDKYLKINNKKVYEIIDYRKNSVKLKPLMLEFNQDDNPLNDIILTFVSDDLYNTTELDYTQPQYNKWRKIPTDKEEPQTIIDRLTQQVEYARIYFEKESKLHNKVKTIGVELPFQFYRNGIVLEEYDPMQKWTNYFYDFDDQQLAYTYLLHAFKQVNSEQIKTDNILEYDRLLLKNMETYLKSVKVNIPK